MSIVASYCGHSARVDFSDRRDVDAQTPGGDVQDKGLDSANGLVFISEPLAEQTEMSGLFSGHLEFMANKSDFDFEVSTLRTERRAATIFNSRPIGRAQATCKI
jgi:hypothetical protein